MASSLRWSAVHRHDTLVMSLRATQGSESNPFTSEGEIASSPPKTEVPRDDIRLYTRMKIFLLYKGDMMSSQSRISKIG